MEEIPPNGRMATGFAGSPSHYGLLVITEKMASSPFFDPRLQICSMTFGIMMYAAWPPQSEKCNDDMDEKNDKIAHLSILTRTTNAINRGANWCKLAICHRQATTARVLDMPS